MQNFNLIIDFKIQNLQIQIIAETQCLDIYFELFNITNPQNPISLFYDFQLSFTKSYQQNLKSKCPICLDKNIKKAFKAGGPEAIGIFGSGQYTIQEG